MLYKIVQHNLKSSEDLTDHMATIDIHVLSRERMTMSWEEFLSETPQGSIALDGAVTGGPRYDEETLHDNFDHHEGVVREATMSTCKQILYAIKGGMMKYRTKTISPVPVYVNDCDQDVGLSCWELENYKLIEEAHSIPNVNRLIELTDRLDVTGGSFPMNLRSELIEQHNWVFAPYTELRKSGGLAAAGEATIKDCIEATMARITKFMMGESGKIPLDTRHEILYESPHGYKLIDEIGGNDARYALFAQGLDAFISIVATRPDGRRVVSFGRRSRHIPFPLQELYKIYNEAEGLPDGEGCGGSDIVGGSSRQHGTGLTNDQLIELTDGYFRERYGEPGA